MGYTSLDTLPAEIGNLTQLQKLELMGNGLTTLPTTLSALTNLVDLDLTNNFISNDGVARIVNILTKPVHPNLIRLNLVENDDINGDGFSVLAELVVIKSLLCVNIDIGYDDVRFRLINILYESSISVEYSSLAHKNVLNKLIEARDDYNYNSYVPVAVCDFTQ